MSDDQKFELVSAIGALFMRKVAAERRARLAGEIVAADFCLRQVTFMEVLLDLSVDALGFDAHELLHELRRGAHGLFDIATTILSASPQVGRVVEVSSTQAGWRFAPAGYSSPILNAAINASWGIDTDPYSRILFFPSFCFSNSLRFRVASPP